MPLEDPRSWRTGRTDRTRARATILNQSMFGIVVLLVAMVALATNQEADNDVVLLAMVIVFVATAASLLVPWNSLPVEWITAIPTLDILSVALLRLGSPTVGYALLWVFPAMWLAGMFGRAGLIGAVSSVTGVFWLSTLLVPAVPLTLAAILIPIIVAVAAVTAFLTARRNAAQRVLLERQGKHLVRSLRVAQTQESSVTDVLNAVNFGVIRLAPDGRVILRNHAERALHEESSSLRREGVPLYAEDGITALAPNDEPLARARRREEFAQEIVWLGAPGGKRRALSMTARRLTVAGEDVGGLITTHDVTGEISALRAREDLVRSVSHELRTPLTSILGYLDLTLDDDGLSDRSRSRLEIAERNASRLLDLVADILARPTTNAGETLVSVSPETVDLASLALRAIEAAQPVADARNIVLDGAAIEPVLALADPLRIGQVIDNLVGNAIKFHDVTAGTVWIGTTSDGDHAWIVVRDDGPGIRADEQEQVFSRFFRSDTVRGGTIHGSGLGLAIARQLVRAHGGEISLESDIGKGATFIVRLPLARDEVVS